LDPTESLSRPPTRRSSGRWTRPEWSQRDNFYLLARRQWTSNDAAGVDGARSRRVDRCLSARTELTQRLRVLRGIKWCIAPAWPRATKGRFTEKLFISPTPDQMIAGVVKANAIIFSVERQNRRAMSHGSLAPDACSG
jgi:hypothetical protein